MNYIYKFTKEKKLDAKRTRMAQVIVYDLKDKVIGSWAFTYLPKHNKEQEIQDKITMLIREYELSKIWNSIGKGLK